MRRSLLGLIGFSILLTHPLFSQRVISQLKPDPIAPNRELTFSSNYAPLEGRIAPNVVFATVNGRLRGFVSYPAVLNTGQTPSVLTSDPGAVVVFDPLAEPDMLDDGTLRIKPEKVIRFGTIGTPPQPARPLQMTLSPDGKVLAVVNEASNAISLIDVQSAELKTTTSLPDALFAFGNNVVFAPGGTLEQGYTAYISSHRQNALFIPVKGDVLQLRIRPDFGLELSARLEVGIGPSALTLSEDGGLLSVVNTLYQRQGGPGGPIVVPAYVALIDTRTFRVKTELRPNPNDTFFFDLNTIPVFLTLSDDAGRPHTIFVVGTHGNCAVSPALPAKVLVFDTDTGGLLATHDVGCFLTAATMMPAGSATVKSLMFTDPNSLAGSLYRVDLDGSKIFSDSADTRQQGITHQQFLANNGFASVTQTVFPFDQTRPFVPAASNIGSFDRVISFDLGSGAIDTSTLVGDVQDRATDFPIRAMLTPDRQIMAVLNIGTGTIDLVRGGYHLDFPFVVSSASLFTRMNLVNTGAQPVPVRYSLINDGGVPLVTRPPVTAPLLGVATKGQFGQTAFSLFDLDPSQSNNGWIDVSTDSSSVLGSFLVGNTDTGSLDGALPVYRHISRNYTRLVFPIVLASDLEFTQFTLVNPTYSSASVALQLFKFSGERVGDQPVGLSIPGRGKISRFLGDVFTSGLDTFTYGYLVVDSNVGLIGFGNNIYAPPMSEDKFSIAAVTPVPVASPPPSPTTYYLPLVALGGGTDTVISLVNLAAPPPDEMTPPLNADVAITVFNQNGAVVRETVRRTIPPQNQLRAGLLSLLGPDLPSTMGWAKIEVTTANTPVVADATLFGPDRTYAGTVPVLTQGLMDFYLVEVINRKPMDDVYVTDSLLTSVALTNLESAPASVILEVFDPNGQPVAGTRTQFPLAPMSQVAKFLDDILPRSVELSGGSLRIQSDRKLLAVQGVLASDLGTRDYLVMLPPQAP